MKAIADHTSARGLKGFVEAGGYIAIDAEHHSRAVGNSSPAVRVDAIGRAGSGMTPTPVTAPAQTPGSGPCLEYDVTLVTEGEVTVWAQLSPRNPAPAHDVLRHAISFDGAAPQTVDIIAATGSDDGAMNKRRERNTSNNINETSTKHTLSAGTHKLKFWMVDPSVLLQRLMIDTDGLPAKYLGPQESHRAV
ncbi:hypothetical protein ABT167_38490 [Streptomyces sp. NPDC001792]|uniref:hypothetical protein n=1 Tax=Streptomyces sp. NPDC001792 TaxID=3154524 RepID=UPI0033177590